MTKIELLDLTTLPAAGMREPENWYAEPFTKRTGCKTPGQCGGDCNCGCPYNTMTEVERLPLIEEIARIFPNEWLAFIISPVEDDEYEPTHGKLVAHSSHPDEVYDAVNRVLWNQHVYIYFNGDFDPMQASYGSAWEQEAVAVAKRAYSGPQALPMLPATPPQDLTELIHSALDQLYDGPKINEAIRRLRLARVRAAQQGQNPLLVVLDTALDRLETPLPVIDEVIWQLEEGLADLES
ncbi:MAG: hypothetical protein HS126_36535 [Anaerolineales bacterium]|nr:hypothetical protein [Anaerolineales bacterium]